MTLTTDREEFEKWFELTCGLPWGFLAKRREPSGRYMEIPHEDAWQVWQASRELLANREAQPTSELAAPSAGVYCPSDSAETIEENPKSWAAWKREAERLQDIIDQAANREAQPVAYAVFADNGNIRIWSTDKGITDNVGVSVPLFTAPPAPAVNAAPDFEAWFNSPEAGLRVVNFHIQHELQKKAWEACRAAMLAQPVSSGYKLVPVEPTDEQLRLMLAVQWPALYREHLRHPLNGPKSREENERQIAIVKRQYAAMLAAAPEGGNDHDTRR
ncbi:TPA: hypothetical protein ACQDQ8_005013 [Serratia marcescens]